MTAEEADALAGQLKTRRINLISACYRDLDLRPDEGSSKWGSELLLKAARKCAHDVIEEIRSGAVLPHYEVVPVTEILESKR